MSEDSLKASYYDNESMYRFPYIARVSHILFAIGDAPEPEDIQKAIINADRVKNRLSAGDQGAFEQAAREYSQDIASGPKGGDLGFVPRQALPQAMADAIFQATPGTVVGPIRTDSGFHLAMITDREMSFQEALPELKRLKEIETMSLYVNSWIEEQRGKADIDRLVDPLEFLFPPADKK